jgi:DNA replication protein DnaC
VAATSEQYLHHPQQTKSVSSSLHAISPPSLNDADIDTKIVAQAPVELSSEQRFLLNQVINNGKSVFFTGSAGTGKSVLLRQLIQELKEVYMPGQVAVTASTGIAACNIGGSTLHSFAGVGLGTGTVEQLLKKLATSKGARARWRKVKVLIIDESKLEALSTPVACCYHLTANLSIGSAQPCQLCILYLSNYVLLFE